MKNLILFYDTETTGLPEWKLPSDDVSQPHLVQLACILADADTREEIASMDVIVSADGWTIDPEVSAIHGITTLYSQQVGVPTIKALDMLMAIWRDPETLRVAHNKTFDQRIIRIGLKRHNHPAIDAWSDKESHACTIRMYQKMFGGRPIKLADAYKEATGQDLENAHSALADTRACMEVYWWLLDQQNPQAVSPFDLMETAQ